MVVRRRDGLATYQLAVVVDDAYQGVTRVVRGADLLASTPWQMELQEALGLQRPIYGHLPLVTEPDGSKLAKSRRSLPLDLTVAPGALFSTLTHLSQATAARIWPHASIKEVWKWALRALAPTSACGQDPDRVVRQRRQISRF